MVMRYVFFILGMASLSAILFLLIKPVVGNITKSLGKAYKKYERYMKK